MPLNFKINFAGQLPRIQVHSLVRGKHAIMHVTVKIMKDTKLQTVEERRFVLTIIEP